jgi:DNA-binding response OmpR family regulator
MTIEASPPSASRVLIIDDDPSALECFTQMLVDHGYAVRAVETFDAGLTEMAAAPPDAVLLDLHLPIVDGREGLRRLRAAPLNLTVPVAILTGDYFIDEDVTRELLALGARIYFKPVWDTDLRRIVEALVAQRTGQLR